MEDNKNLDVVSCLAMTLAPGEVTKHNGHKQVKRETKMFE